MPWDLEYFRFLPLCIGPGTYKNSKLPSPSNTACWRSTDWCEVWDFTVLSPPYRLWNSDKFRAFSHYIGSGSQKNSDLLLPVEALGLRKISREAWRHDSRDMRHNFFLECWCNRCFGNRIESLRDILMSIDITFIILNAKNASFSTIVTIRWGNNFYSIYETASKL